MHHPYVFLAGSGLCSASSDMDRQAKGDGWGNPARACTRCTHSKWHAGQGRSAEGAATTSRHPEIIHIKPLEIINPKTPTSVGSHAWVAPTAFANLSGACLLLPIPGRAAAWTHHWLAVDWQWFMKIYKLFLTRSRDCSSLVLAYSNTYDTRIYLVSNSLVIA